MRRSIKSTLVCLLGTAIGFVLSARATNYYVNSNGDDSNDGKTPQTAWQNPEKATNIAKAGDTVYLSGTFKRTLIPVNSGTRNAPIFYTSEGKEKARIITEGKNRHGIYLESKEFITFENLEVSSKDHYGFLSEGIGDGCKNITFNNTYVHDCGVATFLARNKKDSNLILKNNQIRGKILLQEMQQLTILDNVIETQFCQLPVLGKGAYTAKSNIWLVDKIAEEIFQYGDQKMSLSTLKKRTGSHEGDIASTPTMRRNDPQLEARIKSKINSDSVATTPYTPNTTTLDLNPKTPQTNVPIAPSPIANPYKQLLPRILPSAAKRPTNQVQYSTPQVGGLVDPRLRPSWSSYSPGMQAQIWSQYTNAVQQHIQKTANQMPAQNNPPSQKK